MKRKYEYIGAGLFAPYHMGIAIYIKYCGNKNEIRLKEQSSRHVHILCPDRELFIVNDKHFAHPYQVPFEYDEVVNVSPFWALNGANTGITNYMMNYSQYIGKEQNSPKLRKHGRSPLHNQTIFADSGGFQLKSGKFDYISPIKLTHWYNENVDVGLVLDVPSGGVYWNGLIEKMGRAQRANIEKMLEHKRDSLELLNILHGRDLADINKYRAIVEHPDINRMAIGGAYFQSILNSIHISCQILTTGRKYPHYHMLGVGNIRQVYAYMRMAHKGIADYITSDSSSFLQEAMNKGYFLCPTIDSPPRYLNIGDQYNKPNAGQTLPCSCPVCKAVKYTDVLNSFTGNILAFLLLYHNLFRFTQHMEAMYDVISTASKDDLKALLRSQLETRKFGRDEVLACIDYVDDFASAGVDYAAQNCAYFLTQPDEVENADTMPSLFGNQANISVDRNESDDLDEANPIRVRMEQVLDSFITTSSDKHVKVQMDKRIIKTEGHMTETSGFVRLPGKAKIKKTVNKSYEKEKELREKEKARIKQERESNKTRKFHKTAEQLNIKDNESALAEVKEQTKVKPKSKKVKGKKE